MCAFGACGDLRLQPRKALAECHMPTTWPTTTMAVVAANAAAMREVAAASGVANDPSRSPSRILHGSAARSTVFKEQVSQLMGKASVYAVDDNDDGGTDFSEPDDGGAGSRRRRPASARGSGAGAAAGSVAATAGGGRRRRHGGGDTDKPFDPAKSSRWRAALLEQGGSIMHPMPPPTKVISAPGDSFREIVDEKARVLVNLGKGVGVERIRRIVAEENCALRCRRRRKPVHPKGERPEGRRRGRKGERRALDVALHVRRLQDEGFRWLEL